MKEEVNQGRQDAWRDELVAFRVKQKELADEQSGGGSLGDIQQIVSQNLVQTRVVYDGKPKKLILSRVLTFWAA